MYEIIAWVWEHRNQPLTWATVLSFLWLILDKLGRKLINSQLKRLFRIRQKSEFAAYIENQRRIESKLDLLLEERGLKWAAHSAQVSKSQDATDGRKNSLKPTWETRARALFIGAFTSLTGRLSRSKTRGESIQMKKFTSRKFILAVTGAILIVLNDGLDLGIDSETVIAFAGLLATWIVGESAVDAKRAGGKNKIDEPGDTGPAV